MLSTISTIKGLIYRISQKSSHFWNRFDFNDDSFDPFYHLQWNNNCIHVEEMKSFVLLPLHFGTYFQQVSDRSDMI